MVWFWNLYFDLMFCPNKGDPVGSTEAYLKALEIQATMKVHGRVNIHPQFPYYERKQTLSTIPI